MSTPNSNATIHSKVIENGVVKTDTTTQYPREKQFFLVTNDEVVENYELRSKKGEIFNNVYSNVRNQFESGGTYVAQSLYNSPGWKASSVSTGTNAGFLQSKLDAGMAWPTVNLSEDIMSAVAKAQIEAQSNVNATDFDVTVFAAEWAKTKVLHNQLGDAIVDLVRFARKRSKRPSMRKTPEYDEKGNPKLNRKGQPIYRYIHSPGSSDFDPAFRKAHALSDMYLIKRFGIDPLLHDIDGALKVLNNLHTARKTARGDYAISDSKTVVTTVPWSVGSYEVTLTTHKTLSIRAGILYDTTITGGTLGRFGVTRPLSAAWELIPFSFIVDRYVRVGEWLDAVQPSGSHRNLAAWVTRLETTVHTASIIGNVNHVSGYTTHKLDVQEGATKIERFKRRDPWLPSLPKLPAVRHGFQPQFVVDYAMLLLQKIRR